MGVYSLHMTKQIILAGGSGLVGTYLRSFLESKGYSVIVLSRNPQKTHEVHWNPSNGQIDLESIKGAHAIVHLSGAGIVDRKWTTDRKKELISSRVEPIRFLNAHLESFTQLNSIVGISGVNCYGFDHEDHLHVEDDPYGSDFIDKIVVEWEKAYGESANLVENTTVYRMGVVFTSNGGALEKLVKPIKMSIGSPLGTGRQNMPWIHIDDVCGAIEYAITHSCKGTYNLIGGNANNKEVTNAIAASLNKKIWLPNVPSFLLRLMFGERSDILLKGVQVSNHKLKEAGYTFRYEDIQEACNDLLK